MADNGIGLLLRAGAIWAGILVLANLNGAARELLIAPVTGPAAAHIVSTLLLCMVIAGVAWVAIRWIGPASVAQAAAVGLLWLLLTLIFEFLAGHYLFGLPWTRLLAEYDISAGRIWILVPLVTLISPPWAWRLHPR